MGFLEELTRKMQEAAQESRARNRQRSGPAWAVPSEVQQANVVRRDRRPSQEQAEQPAPRQPHKNRPSAAKAAPAAPLPGLPVPHPSRYGRFLRQPKTVRDALILSELLQLPLALRHGLLKTRRRQ